MKKAICCAVVGCVNRSDQGEFVGLLCAPCHYYISGQGDEARSSQAYRNAALYARTREISQLIKIGRDLLQRALDLDINHVDPRPCLFTERRRQLLDFLESTAKP